MKSWIIGIILITVLTDPLLITRINKTKREAREAFNQGDFQKAINKYRYLSDSLGVKEDELFLNLAHAYFQTRDTIAALSTYQQLTASPQNPIRSKAQLQIGIINHQQNKLEEALNNFKQAIKADPANVEARYNYEMLKKKLEEKKKQDQENKDQQNKDQQNKDQQNKDQQKQDQEKQNKDQQEKQDQQQKEKQSQEEQKKKEEEKKQQENQEQKQQEDQQNEKKQMPQEVADKLEQMKIDPEKAKMILEAMKNQEVQYLQQNKRKATQPKDKGKPDW